MGRDRGGVAAALARIKAKTLVIGITSDQLFPVSDSQQLAVSIADANLQVIDSLYGHDGFLLETQQLTTLITDFYKAQTQHAKKTAARIALFGFGCVGSGFYQLLNQSRHTAEVTAVAVKNPDKQRAVAEHLISHQPAALIEDTAIDVVVEAIDDETAAFNFVSRALRSGKQVVSASKRMLAQNLSELIDIQQESGSTLLYEPAVAGSIPIIRQLNDYFQVEDNQSITGILNGSSNYILSALSADEKTSYEAILAEAQQAGFAETDPLSDVAGYDAKYKAVLLALHGFGILVKPEQVLNLGIQNISREDIDWARQQGCVIKQVARIDKQDDSQVRITVTPECVPIGSELAQTDAENNIVIVKNRNTDFTFKGKGAGSIPTGTAVLADFKALHKGGAYDYHIRSDLQLDEKSFVYAYIRKQADQIPPLHGVVISRHKDYVILKTTTAELLEHQKQLEQNYFVALLEAKALESC